DQNLAEALDAPIVGQTFSTWEDLDRFISLYARSQNFVSVIRGSEYDDSICRSRRYACKHQGRNIVKNKTNIAENQRQTRSKRTGCHWQVRATFPKKTGILSISSVYLVHNNHLMENGTNKFASKYRAFSEDMLKDIEF
ncbi:20867_t:CDS:1, partial [Dentiscutata erythropus]